MCGLFGISTNQSIKSNDLERCRSALKTLYNRGPDQSGEYFDPLVYMGHRRLSIIDTSDNGKQPYISNNIIITVNGEIYNFKKLKKELEVQGYIFNSSSDSEVVLHGYHYWGIDGLVSKLEGMYAVIIYDKQKRKIYAFRDIVGIKPMYYYFDKNKFIWASELKAIKKFLPSEDLHFNKEALLDFLVYRYIPAPKSLYKNVFKLTPASIIEYCLDRRTLNIKKYWELKIDPTLDSKTKIKEEIILKIKDSVNSQLISDVPVGSFLSGGIDSSTITYFAGKEIPKIKSFSIGFKNSSKDETKFAKILSEFVKTEHYVDFLETEKEVSNLFERMHEWFGEPFGDTSAVPTYAISKFAKKYVKVVLSGDGGDELFGGYNWYNHFNASILLNKFFPFFPKKGIKLPFKVPGFKIIRYLTSKDPLWSYALLRGSISPEKIDYWKLKIGISKDYDPLWAYRLYYKKDISPKKAAQFIDFHTYLPDDILTKVDRVSMFNSLECRPPLLSKDLIEFAFSIPDNFLYDDKNPKSLLKDSLRNILPKEILQKKKQGFSIPNGIWKDKMINSKENFQEAMLNWYLEKF